MARNRIIYQNEGLFIGPATDFATLDEVIYTSDFTSNTDGWSAENGTAAVSAGELSFEASGGLVNYSYSVKRTSFLTIGRTYKITGKVKIKNEAENFMKVELRPFTIPPQGIGNALPDPIATTTTKGSYESFSATFMATDEGLRFYGVDSQAADDEPDLLFSADQNDHFYIKDIVITVDPDLRIQSNLDKVTSVSYSYEISRADVSVIGKAGMVDRPINSSPAVGLQIDYLLRSFTNEYLLGFGVTLSNMSSRFPMLPDEFLAKSGMANEIERHNDRKNIYLTTTEEGIDLSNSETGKIESILSFNNCQLSSYSANFEVGAMPSASVSLIGTDSNYYSKPRMDVPLRNKQTGAVTETFTVDIPTGSDGLTDFENKAPEVLLPGNMSISISRSDDGEKPKDLFNLQNDKVQSLGIEMSLERHSIELPGHKINYDKILNFPIRSSASMSIIEDGGQTGILADFIDKDLEYDININIKNKSKAAIVSLDFLKAKFDSINYSNAIGDNKSADLSFSCSLDPLDTTKGMFISGSIY